MYVMTEFPFYVLNNNPDYQGKQTENGSYSTVRNTERFKISKI